MDIPLDDCLEMAALVVRSKPWIAVPGSMGAVTSWPDIDIGSESSASFSPGAGRYESTSPADIQPGVLIQLGTHPFAARSTIGFVEIVRIDLHQLDGAMAANGDSVLHQKPSQFIAVDQDQAF